MKISRRPKWVVPESRLLGPAIEIYTVRDVKSLDEFNKHFADAILHHTPAVRGQVDARADYKNPAGILRYQASIKTVDDQGAIPAGTKGYPVH